ncbi:MAG: carboxylating nicotinate-nucleotide diphosphorylase [Cytophagales bacterium]
MFPPYITVEKLNIFIQNALQEDIGTGDHTSLATVGESKMGKAQLIFKDNGMVAGLELSKYIFEAVDSGLKIEYFVKDGDAVKKGEIGFVVEGKSISILAAERLVLNCMQRMSAIATLTSDFNNAIKHTKAKLLDTRKTTPNFRMLEKWAVLIGGGKNHRFGLYDMILIKDNHIDYSGGIVNALENTANYLKNNDLDLKIVIETRNLTEVHQALSFGNIERILLDNMPNEMLKEAVQICKGKVDTEASGGVNINTIKAIAETGVDYISVGALTHSYNSLDMSLKALK